MLNAFRISRISPIQRSIELLQLDAFRLLPCKLLLTDNNDKYALPGKDLHSSTGKSIHCSSSIVVFGGGGEIFYGGGKV